MSLVEALLWLNVAVPLLGCLAAALLCHSILKISALLPAILW